MYIERDMTMYEIADEVDCGVTSVSNWCKKYNIEKVICSEEELREMYIEQNMTQYEVADELGCSQTVVSRWCNKYNIETEMGGSYPTLNLSEGE